MKPQLNSKGVACNTRLLTAIFAIAITLSCSSGDDEDGNDGGSRQTIYGTPISHDDETYQTVKIGNQTWMAKNLSNAVEGSACYDNDSINCTKYGRLYNWATAMALPSSCNSTECSEQIQAKHRGICPSGYHIPNDADWDELMTAVGGFLTAGKHLKATSGWNDYNGSSGNGNDTYGFSALPGGVGSSDGDFANAGKHGTWWSATEHSSSRAYSRYMGYYYESTYWFNDSKHYLLFSVRCLQD